MKNLVLAFLVMLAFFLQEDLYSQKETWNWCYGSFNGLSFAPNGNNPKLLQNINMRSYKSPGSFSDKNGNLLFYTNGINVWNRNNEIMSGLANISGKTDENNIWEVFVLPAPGDTNQYYIFKFSNDT